MAAPKIDPHKNFARALVLLRKNSDSEACLVFARIAGWNFAQVETPLMAVAMWNLYLPPKLSVNFDAFEDKGETPEHLTKLQMQEIQQLEGVPTDPFHPDFQPFYDWTFGHPKQSKLYIERQQKYEQARADYYAKYQPTKQRMPFQRYWGD